jgi:hypothetical protein
MTDGKNMAKRFLLRIFGCWDRLWSRKPDATIVVGPHGFELLKNGKALFRVIWDDVEQIQAFKRDLGVVDDIRIAYQLRSGSWVEVSEDLDGYKEMLEAIDDRFHGIDKEWWPKVAFPAFATNLTTLWSRPKSGGRDTVSDANPT